jgi:hypothetical protein
MNITSLVKADRAKILVRVKKKRVATISKLSA